MSFCRNCGKKLSDSDVVCPSCGTQVQNNSGSSSTGNSNGGMSMPPSNQNVNTLVNSYPQNGGNMNQPYPQNQGNFNQQGYYNGPNGNYNNQNYNNPGYVDNGGFGWGLLGCCFPLVGLILYLVWKNEKPRTAKAVGIGALISVGISLFYYIIVVAFGLSLGFWL